MSGPRLVIFDVDGTLIDSQRVILAAMVRAFGQAGHPVPAPAAILSIVGLSLPEAMAALAPELPETETLALAALYREGFRAQRGTGERALDTPLYPGARAALDALGLMPDVRLGIATGKARAGLDHVLALHDLAGRFATMQTADGHPSKPDPSMLRAALAETGCSPERAVMIGDTEFDIAMGRAAGVHTIGVAWGYHAPERLVAAGADRVIAGFGDLQAVLDARWSEAP